MALSISLGQFYPADSALHRLDPRVKVIATLALTVSVFFIKTIPQLALGYAFALVLIAISRVPAREVFSSVKPLVVVMGVLSVFNLFMTRTGEVVATLGPVTIMSGGVYSAFLYTLRLVIAVILVALMLHATTPTEHTDAADALLAPLSRIGLPGHEIAMIFSLMLRFIPTLGDEASAILDAQTSRGGSLAEGSFVHRVRSLIPVIVALLASSMRHANGLARAMDARCYEGGAERSHWHPLKMRRADWLATCVAAAYLVVLAIL